MPGTFAALFNDFPDLKGKDSTEKKFSGLEDYMYQLIERIGYALTNLDENNFNVKGLQDITDPIHAEIKDTEAGLITLIDVTAGEIKFEVRKDYAAEWSSAKEYKVNDVVWCETTVGGITAVRFYRCTQQHTNKKPPNLSYWTEIPAGEVAYSRFDMTAEEIRSEVSRATLAEGTLSAQIDLKADEILLDVHKEYAVAWSGNSVAYKVNDVVKVTTTVGDTTTLAFYKCTQAHASEQANKPGTSGGRNYWTSIPMTDVAYSRFDMTADEIRSEVTRATAAEGTLSSTISQMPDKIMLRVQAENVDLWQVSHPYYVHDIVKVFGTPGDLATVSYYECNRQHTSTNTTMPGSGTQWTGSWDLISTPPNVQSMIDMNLNGITLSYDNTGVTGDNSAYIKLNKNGVEIGGETVQMTNVKADSLTANAVNAIRLDADQITTGSLDAGNVSLKDTFTVYATYGGQTYNCGSIGGLKSATEQGVSMAADGIKKYVEVTKDHVELYCATNAQNYTSLELTPSGITAKRRVNGGTVQTVDLFA